MRIRTSGEEGSKGMMKGTTEAVFAATLAILLLAMFLAGSVAAVP